MKSRDRGVDLRGTIIDGHAGLSAKANLFARRYSPPTQGPKLRLPRLASSPRVTPPEVTAALHKTQPAKAPGPDGIHPEFLKEGLGPRGLLFLTSLIDASVYTGYVPRHWKHAYWIPILKPNKPAEESGSYRPISLTSVISKVVERVMDARIRAHPACQIDDRQHAFRRAHRTEDALARLVDTTNRSWNDAYVGKFGALKRNLRSSGRAAATLLDLNSAFDNLRHDRLLLQLRQQGFPAYITRWLMSFLTGRTAQVFVHGLTSNIRQLSRGAPQGTVLGPLLFNLYINPLMDKIRTVPKVDPILFADDITLLATGNTAKDCVATTQQAVNQVVTWCEDNGMPLAPAKTRAILLTPSTQPEPNDGLNIGPVHIPITPDFDPSCKLLGIHLDSRLTFPRHIAVTRAKATQHLRLINRAINQCGPSTITLRTFGKALVESRLFYAVGGWGATVSPSEIALLETTQRELARTVTGIVASAHSAATLLEANIVPASVVVKTRAVGLIERWRRLPTSDLRNRLINQPLPAPLPRQYGRQPTYFPHPWTSAQRTLSDVLTHRHVPHQHSRLPVLIHRRTAPYQAAIMSRVHIYPNAVGAPPTLPDKGTEEGTKLRSELNRASWDANHKRHGSFGAEIWTDGGVLHAEQPECISAAAGHLYLPPSPHPVATFGTSAGRLACSYTAEFVALSGSLAQFAPQIPDGTVVLIAVDSQSLLQALSKGPLLTEEDHEDQLWFDFLAMAKRGCTLVIQFFYSHVDFPPRNSTVDEAVTRLLEDPTLDHDTPGLWLTDVVRATHRFLYHAWLQTLADPRVTLCGLGRSPLREIATWSRADQILFSRSRTDALPEFGTYRIRLGLTTSTACRWCGLIPPGYPSSMPDDPAHPTPSSLSPPPASPTFSSSTSTDPPQPLVTTGPPQNPRHKCPHCQYTYTTRQNMLRHLTAEHAGDPIPNAATYTCECGKTFPKPRSRAVHRIACAVWHALVPVAERPAAPLPPQSAESVCHLLECPGLQSLRQLHHIKPAAQPPLLPTDTVPRNWVDFLLAALALIQPPTTDPAEEPPTPPPPP